MDNKIGVNVFGYINGEFGLGEAVRLNIKSLKKVNIPVSIVNYDVKTPHRHDDHTFTDFSTDFPYDVNLVLISPAEVTNLVTYKDADKLIGKFNILFLFWESEYFPKEYIKNLSFFDEIWVSTKFCQDIISRVSNVPVINFPLAIELQSSISTNDIVLNLYDKTKFNFLFVFDYHSTLERKNTLNLIDAFETAFGKENQDVCLTIKTSMSKRHPEEKEKLFNKIKGFKNIKIVELIFDKIDLNNVIKGCDCYVSLHRSEGFGLTMAEAMYFSKPVIGTGYSGNLEFMDFQNSFLVNYELIKSEVDIPNYEKNTVWANPDINHAAQLMKYIRENPEKIKSITEKACIDIHQKFSFETIGNLMKNRIEYIFETNSFDQSKNESFVQEMQIVKLENELKKIKKSKLINLILDIKQFFRNSKAKKNKY